eukprot:TRINITY_DN589_c0_g1_i1.p1 TRINITY_DN589_c0_g1~~TRINITY_DN589_c0_g1_i1.p1  ORF type:complete len:309 (-),score=87.95 TRINITY_DN589_c0_g1_i1:369-1295(-)
MPFGLINSWRTRIKALSPKRREEMKTELGQQARQLHHIARLMIKKYEKPDYQYDKDEQQKFKAFQKHYTRSVTSYNNYRMVEEISLSNESSSCRHFLGLLAGITALIISLVWVAHIGLYMLPDPPVTRMLNEGLIFLDENVWGFFGTTLFAIFSFHLVLCVIWGNMEFGLNCICFKLHPLVPGETIMSSFLMNAMVLGVTSFSTVQFITQAFQGYAGSDSSATVLFHVSARNMTGFLYWFRNNVFIYVLLSVAFLNALRLVCCAPKKNDLEDMYASYTGKGESLEDRAAGLGVTGKHMELMEVRTDGK